MILSQGIAELITTYGMAGVVVVLFGIVVWLIRVIIDMHTETRKAYQENTSAYVKNAEVIQSLERTIQTNSEETRRLSNTITEHITQDHRQ